ncbi:MAG: peptidoglycan-binding domain-containing protein [Planktothrix sp.]
MLQVGSRGKDVSELQATLKLLGYFDIRPGVNARGFHGATLE